MTENQPAISFFNNIQNVQENTFEKIKNEIYDAHQYLLSVLSDGDEDSPPTILAMAFFVVVLLFIPFGYVVFNDTYALKGIMISSGSFLLALYITISFSINFYKSGLSLNKIEDKKFQKEYIHYINKCIEDSSDKEDSEKLKEYKEELANSFANNKNDNVFLFFKSENLCRKIIKKNKEAENKQQFLLVTEKEHINLNLEKNND